LHIEDCGVEFIEVYLTKMHKGAKHEEHSYLDRWTIFLIMGTKRS